MSPRKARPLPDKFWEKVDKSGECWNWTASTTRYGYGHMKHQGRTRDAHRISYELEHGPIPARMLVDHVCQNRRCVRPSHLRLATQKQNLEHREGVYGSSGVRGVYWHKEVRKWQVKVGHNYKHHYGGLFVDLAEAEAAAIELRNELFTHNNNDKKAA